MPLQVLPEFCKSWLRLKQTSVVEVAVCCVYYVKTCVPVSFSGIAVAGLVLVYCF